MGRQVNETGRSAHVQFFLARIARRGERWMKNPAAGKKSPEDIGCVFAKKGGAEEQPRNLG